MTIVPLVQPPGRHELAEAFAHVAATRGGVPNVFRVLAHSPALMRATAELGENVRFHSSLDPCDRELLILTVARETGCVYEWTHHLQGLVEDGMEADEVVAQLSAPDDPLTALIVGVGRSVANGETPEPGTIGELRDRAGPQALVEVLVTAGYYVLLARALVALDVPLEAGVSPLFPPDR